MWSRSRDGLGQNPQRLGLGPMCFGWVSSWSQSNMSRSWPSRSRLGSRAIASRRDVLCLQARAVHTVAAVRTTITFVAYKRHIRLQYFYSFIYLFIIKQNYVMSVFFRHKMT